MQAPEIFHQRILQTRQPAEHTALLSAVWVGPQPTVGSPGATSREARSADTGRRRRQLLSRSGRPPSVATAQPWVESAAGGRFPHSFSFSLIFIILHSVS